MNEPKKKTGPGRPPLPEGATASEQIHIRVCSARKAAYDRAASRAGKTLTAWCRDQLDAASLRERLFEAGGGA